MTAPTLGTYPPNVVPEPRTAYTIAQELSDASERLHALAERLSADPTVAVVADVDALARGIQRACVELRSRRDGAE